MRRIDLAGDSWGAGELLKVQPLWLLPRLSRKRGGKVGSIRPTRSWLGGPNDTDGGIHKHRVEPIHQDQRRFAGQRIRA